ncbi:MAG: hypothetical protein KDH94_03260 [Coxiellaceae bacterium]|nr:hypothetical protein [Coxiellaceae bacterium]
MLEPLKNIQDEINAAHYSEAKNALPHLANHFNGFRFLGANRLHEKLKIQEDINLLSSLIDQMIRGGNRFNVSLEIDDLLTKLSKAAHLFQFLTLFSRAASLNQASGLRLLGGSSSTDCQGFVDSLLAKEEEALDDFISRLFPAIPQEDSASNFKLNSGRSLDDWLAFYYQVVAGGGRSMVAYTS